ncbi:MAG: hypothetical protein ACREQ8_17555 [Woeseiaceae bacterium]
MNCGIGVAERDLLYAKLRALPDTMPPRAVWRRIEAQARAERLFRSHKLKAPFEWFAGAGLAAAVVLAVLNTDIEAPQPISTESDQQVFPTEPVYTATDRAVRLRTLNALMVESQQLEQDLRALPDEPHLVRAGTAATISAVEDQIAAIDYRLNYAPIRMTHEQTELYWRERVRLMNLLVQLRAAQAQRNAF